MIFVSLVTCGGPSKLVFIVAWKRHFLQEFYGTFYATIDPITWWGAVAPHTTRKERL